MDLWHKMVFPVRRLWFVVSTRVKSHREKDSHFYEKMKFACPRGARPSSGGAGLLKLHKDVQTCGYEDVQVMWEMLRRSETERTSPRHEKRKLRPFWRVFIWGSYVNP
ncbi:hypothetical protein SAY86_014104 [Trapa natans]|uniref:Uncharacterized protein n=1 Tax=Trapa natans TaxID=22666 RepID=A0AAN7KTJ6_TRANT|nr:hypothetical protein SAY86_014104 [Trapa natans]